MPPRTRPAKAEYSRTSLRVDAQQNEKRVLAGAKEAFSALGFGASYHDIARFAGVGVGTVYRRYPERHALLEAVLLEIFQELTSKAEAATNENGSWELFCGFFEEFSGYIHKHAGLSENLHGRESRQLETARSGFKSALQQLHASAQKAGLRPEINWQDLVYLAQAVAITDCGFGISANPGHRERAIDVILNGLKRPLEATSR